MQRPTADQLETLFNEIPCGLFVLTAANDGMRCGILTRWVQPCSRKPALVMVSIATGLPIEPIIRDARSFALCQLPNNERILRKRFSEPAERGDDPFITIPHIEAPSGAPVPERALSYFDCQLVRHVDLEADHRLYVGKVTAAGLVQPDADLLPAVELRGESLEIEDVLA